MRFPRVKADGHGFYHCVSRVVEGRFIFQISGHGSAEAERFIKLMRRLEAFSGVRVLTYALMSNHFHLLCEVPEPKSLSEAEVLERIKAGYGSARLQAVQERYFTDGVILGSQGFVDSHFERLKQKLGYRRHRAATCLTALGSPALWIFRDLRLRSAD
jgi:putative transposase